MQQVKVGGQMQQHKKWFIEILMPKCEIVGKMQQHKIM
jgi:hypothetical protein